MRAPNRRSPGQAALSRPSAPARRRAARRRRPGRRASPPAARRDRGSPGARADPRRRPGTARSGSSSASSSASSSRLSTMPSRRRISGPTGKPLRYQAMCLRMSRMPLYGAHVRAEQLGVAAHGRHDPRRGSGGVGSGRPGEGGFEVAEEPRPAEASPADDDAVAPRRRDHPQRVVRAEDVAVAEDGELGGQGVAQARDGRPVRRAGVALRRRARVQGRPRRRRHRRPGARRRGRCAARRRCRCAS